MFSRCHSPLNAADVAISTPDFTSENLSSQIFLGALRIKMILNALQDVVIEFHILMGFDQIFTEELCIAAVLQAVQYDVSLALLCPRPCGFLRVRPRRRQKRWRYG